MCDENFCFSPGLKTNYGKHLYYLNNFTFILFSDEPFLFVFMQFIQSPFTDIFPHLMLYTYFFFVYMYFQ